MSACRIIAVLLLSASTVSAADLRTLKGQTITGDVVKITDKEIVLKSGDKTITTPLTQVVAINLGPTEKLEDTLAYTLVELNDGTQLRCAKVMFKGKNLTLHSLLGQVVELPIAKVTYILNDAHQEKIRKSFKERVLDKKGTRDQVATRNGDVLTPVEGTLGDADAEGKTIDFTIPGGEVIKVVLTKPAALFFLRGVDTTLKPTKCKITDAHQNLIYAASVVSTDEGYTVETTGGVAINYVKEKLARLDYSGGKLMFLSQNRPTSELHTSKTGEDDVVRYRSDENMNGQRLVVGGVPYDVGLFVHSHTELEWVLDGEYREFKAMVGIDDNVGGDAEATVILKVLGDDKELKTLVLSRKDKVRVHELVLTVKDVKKLKIIVTTEDEIDQGKHLVLAEARVSK